jgi:quinol monooxygenase YgiN
MSDRTTLNRRSFLAASAALAAAAAAPRAHAAADASAEIAAATFIHGIAGREDDLRDHLLSLAAPTRAEPGCLQYDLFESPDAPHEFLRVERWRSLANLEAHKAMPHLRASFEKRTREGWTTQITVWRRVPRDVQESKE